MLRVPHCIKLAVYYFSNLHYCYTAGLPVQAGMAWRAGRAREQIGQAVPGPDAEALVLPRPGEGTAGTLQRSVSAGAEPIWEP